MEPKKKIESVLFAVGKEISTARLASLCSLSEKEVADQMKKLVSDYEQRDHSLKIEQRPLGWKMTVQDTYLPLVSQLVTETELDQALMETLAVIAWKYPVVQSDIIKLRHNKAYDHIKRLLEMEFVDKERFGRTYKLRLTKKFFEYFDLPSEEAKKAFLEQVPLEVLENADEVDRAADELQKIQQKESQRMTIGEIKDAEARLEREMKEAENK